MGFATSLGFKPTNIRRSSYGLFSEHMSRGKNGGEICTCKDAIRQACNNHITYNSWLRLVELVVGFATSLGFKPTDIWSSSYGRFSEHLSRRKIMATFVPAKMVLDMHEKVI